MPWVPGPAERPQPQPNSHRPTDLIERTTMSDHVLTNRQGHTVYDNQNQRTVGPRGPATLEN